MASPPSGPSLGDIATAYAAILATIVAILQAAGYLLKRPRVALTLIETYMDPESDDPGPLIVAVQVVNTGPKPIAIKEAGVNVGSKGSISFAGSGREEPLPEGFPLVFQVERDALIGRMIRYGPGTRLSHIYAKDYYGKTHTTRVSAAWAAFASSIVDELGGRTITTPGRPVD